jgi:ankyrin repeat protein/serine/threonine protein kinase
MEDPSVRKFNLETIVGICGGDEEFAIRLLNGQEQLTRNELETKTSCFYDFYYSYDWGRDFGIDNAKRVKELNDFATEHHLRSCRNSMQTAEADYAETFMKQSRDCVIFLTDRYVRRYQEQAFIKTEFELIKTLFPLKRIVFALMEERVNFKLQKYLEILGIADPAAIRTVQLTNVEDPIKVAGEKFLSCFPLNLFEIQKSSQLLSLQPIFEAAISGNFSSVVEAFNRNYINGKEVDKNGYTVLVLAVINRHFPLVKYLVELTDSDVTFVHRASGRSVFLSACLSSNLEIFNYLSELKDVNINQADWEGSSAVHYAVKANQLEMVKRLIEKGGDLTVPNKKGQLPQEICDSEEIRMMLEEAINNEHALLKAVRQVDFDQVQLLLKSPYTDINCVNEDGRTCLYFACMSENLKMISLLLDNGADPKILDNWQSEALGTAAFYFPNVEIVKLLLKAGSRLDLVNIWGNTPLFNACESGNVEVARYLMGKGAKVDLQGTHFKSYLKMSIIEVGIREKNLDIINLLINAGVTVATKLLQELLEFDVDYQYSAFAYNQFALWFSFLQMDHPKGTEVLSKAIQSFPQLVNAKDSMGRIANAVATEKNRSLINSFFLWYGKYRPTQSKAEHCSSTTYVFKGVDESVMNKNGNYQPVAIKLMRYKSHFLKEINSRKANQIDDEFVVQVVSHYPPTMEEAETWPEDIGHNDFGQESSVTKSQAEKMFCVVMTLADRNMFVSLKQERFAGRNFEVVREIFRQLSLCTQHLHSRGILHGDIKPLNIMRIESTWKLIDLDASCRIGKDFVCAKYSTAYCPPESISVNEEKSRAIPRSPENEKMEQYQYSPLIADPSFDVWSLGCVLYQLCSKDALPLFAVGQDDNLSDDSSVDDNLLLLHEWSDHVKQKKLNFIVDPLAKNLLSLMLMKSPEKRPSLQRILSHPFISGKEIARLPETPAQFDVFLSYRVNSDLSLVEEVYHRLIGKGFKVWWDKKCLPVGLDWKLGFCAGLMNSRSFLCVFSKNAINQKDNIRQNFSLLEENSECDNLFLEIRLAFELKRMGYLERMVPLFVGEYRDEIDSFREYDWKTDWPTGKEIIVKKIEDSLTEELERQSLGCSVLSSGEKELLTVSGMMKEFAKCQGIFLVGKKEKALDKVADSVGDMIKELNDRNTTASSNSMAHINVVRRINRTEMDENIIE